MSQVYEFLKDCGVFFVTTIDEQKPVARPFGAVMEYEGDLYLSTSNKKEVYAQLMKNPQIQIVALKSQTREWVRINGLVEEIFNLETKQAMLDTCPLLLTRFDSKECPYYVLLKITQMEAMLICNDVVTLLN